MLALMEAVGWLGSSKRCWILDIAETPCDQHIDLNLHLIVFLANTTRNDAINSHPNTLSKMLQNLKNPVRLPICVVEAKITALISSACIGDAD